METEVLQSTAYKYRSYPSLEQKEFLAQTFGSVRKVYNEVLTYRKNEFEKGNKINYKLSSSYLTQLKKGLPYLQGVSSVALQQSVRNLDSAYLKFFKHLAKYPVYKKKSNKQSFKLTAQAFKLKGNELYLAKVKEPFKLIESRVLDFIPTSVTISKDCANRYFVSFCGEKAVKTKPVTRQVTGIDLGLSSFITLTDGSKVEPLQALKQYQYKLKLLQRKHAKKAKADSSRTDNQFQGKNRNKARLKVAKLYNKITDSRKDYLNKLSSKLINDNQVICLEDLHIKGMIKNHYLAKAIQDCSWSEFVRQLEYKAKYYGRTLVKVNRYEPTSWVCSACLKQSPKQGLAVRKWTCQFCSVQHDRDINAAKNILRVGLTQLFKNSMPVEGPLAGLKPGALTSYVHSEAGKPDCEVRNHRP